MLKLLKILFLFVLNLSFQLEGCSTFLFEKDGLLFVGNHYDWIVEEGLVIVNKRQIAKEAMSLEQPIRWISKYGSLTFNQAGRELPFGGMNEAGLVVEIMWLDETVYPSPDSRSALNELQWIQYQLDTAASVEEVLESDKIVRIQSVSQSLNHFMVIDSKGNWAVIEFLKTGMKVHARGDGNPPVLTNDTYQNSLEFLKRHQGFGGNESLPDGFDSLPRFARIASLLQNFLLNGKPPESLAFDILSSVSNFEIVKEKANLENFENLIRTKWNLVYDISNKTIHFLTSSHQKRRTMRMDSFNFNGDTEVLVLNIQEKLEGDVSHFFVPYTYQLNRNQINYYYDEVPFLRRISEKFRELTARYPETTYYVQE